VLNSLLENKCSVEAAYTRFESHLKGMDQVWYTYRRSKMIFSNTLAVVDRRVILRWLDGLDGSLSWDFGFMGMINPC